MDAVQTLIEAQFAAVLDRLMAAAHGYGSPRRQERGQAYYPEFDRIDSTPFKIRFAAIDTAGEFMKSPEAEAIVAQAGWAITVLHDRSERRGLNPDGSQRWSHFVEVRLENLSGEKPYEPMRELYHVTPTEYVPRILRQGLLPRRTSRPDQHRYPPRIHFATSLEAAKKIERLFRNYDQQHQIDRSYSILRVAPEAVDPVYVDPEFHRDGVYTTKPVPPSALQDD